MAIRSNLSLSPLAIPVNSGAPTIADKLGAVAWWRADLGIARTGADVTLWANQASGGASYDLTPQGVSPTFNASDANFDGVPSVTCTAGLQTGVVSLAAPQFFLLIGKTPNAAGAYNCAMDDGAFAHTVYKKGDTDTAAAYAGAVLDSGTNWVNSAKMVATLFNGASSKFYFNSVTATTSGSTGANATITRIVLGDYSTGGLPFNGPIAEAFVLPAEPSALQSAILLQYLTDRYPSLGVV